jgi:hypothetical protein
LAGAVYALATAIILAQAGDRKADAPATLATGDSLTQTQALAIGPGDTVRETSTEDADTVAETIALKTSANDADAIAEAIARASANDRRIKITGSSSKCDFGNGGSEYC